MKTALSYRPSAGPKSPKRLGWIHIAIAATVLMCCVERSVAQQTGALHFSEMVPCASKGRTGAEGGSPSCDMSRLQSRARQGSVADENELGLIRAASASTSDQNLLEARKLFQKAAQQGFAPSQVNLAVLYVYGRGVPRNYGIALYWMQSAAKQNNARAFTNLGLLYFNGWGVGRDYTEALKNFQSGANAGDPTAMSNLGYLYDQGLGVRKDQQVAADWYGRAADQGDAMGQNNLADLVLRGEGVPQSDSQAFALFEEAAAQGNTGAQIKLGYMYLAGRGATTDFESAYAWIKSASLAGDTRGQPYLPYLEAHMSKDQLARATVRANELHSRPEANATAQAFLPRSSEN